MSGSPCFTNKIFLECIKLSLWRCTAHPRPRHGSSFSNHVCATLAPNPNLVHSPSLHVDSGPDAICYLFTIRLIRIPQGHFAIDNKMRCQPAVRVGSVVWVSAVAQLVTVNTASPLIYQIRYCVIRRMKALAERSLENWTKVCWSLLNMTQCPDKS